MLFGILNARFDKAINGISINRVRVAKFIGVLIDEKLNWKDHIAHVKSKLVGVQLYYISVAKS